MCLFCAFAAADAIKGAGEAITASSSWGLSFQEKGKTPVGNATKEELQKYDACYAKDTREKVIFLTFDAGYENGYTQKILDILKEKKVPAAFFLVGNYMEKEPQLVKRMAEEGHIVGNHTYSHPDMSEISDEAAFEKELKKLEELYFDITGKQMQKFYRPPQGKFSEQNLKMAQKLGYKTVFWSLAYMDWLNDKQPTRQDALEKLTSRIHPGAVILLHSTSKTNAEILSELIDTYKNAGYSFKSIEELFGE